MTARQHDSLIALLRALRRGGTIRELEEATGIPERSIRRMIAERIEPSGIEVIRPQVAGRRAAGVYRLREPKQVLQG